MITPSNYLWSVFRPRPWIEGCRLAGPWQRAAWTLPAPAGRNCDRLRSVERLWAGAALGRVIMAP